MTKQVGQASGLSDIQAADANVHLSQLLDGRVLALATLDADLQKAAARERVPLLTS